MDKIERFAAFADDDDNDAGNDEDADDDDDDHGDDDTTFFARTYDANDCEPETQRAPTISPRCAAL